MTVATRTYTTLQADALGDDFDSTKYTTQVQNWLNEALGRIGRRVDALQRRSSVTVNIVAGTISYALPADFVRLHSLRDGAQSTGPLIETDPDTIDQSDVNSRGAVELYAVDGTNLLVWPNPSAAKVLTLRYWALPATMAAGGDVPSIPTDYVDLLVTYTRARLFRAEDDFQSAGGLMAEFEAAIVQMRIDLQFSSEQRTVRTPSMFGFRSWPTFRTR